VSDLALVLVTFMDIWQRGNYLGNIPQTQVWASLKHTTWWFVVLVYMN